MNIKLYHSEYKCLSCNEKYLVAECNQSFLSQADADFNNPDVSSCFNCNFLI